jgi:hypothetical protein
MAYTRYASSPAQMISMMIGSEFISASTHTLAKTHVSQRHGKEETSHTKKDYVLHQKVLPDRSPGFDSSDSPLARPRM